MPDLDAAEGFESQVTVDSAPPSGTGIVQSVGNPAGVSFVSGRVAGTAIRITEDGVTATNWRQNWPSTGTRVFHGKFRMPLGAPSVDRSHIFGISTSTGTQQARLSVRSAANGGLVEMQAGTGTRQAGSDVTDGEWHTVDLLCDTSGATWTVAWYIDEVELTTASSAAGQTPTNSERVFAGSGTATHNAVVEWDDWLGSADAADYPISNDLSSGQDVYIAVATPSATGTSVSGTNSVVNDAGSAAGPHQSIDDWATTTADDTTYLTYQSTTTSDAASNYAEMQVTDLPTGVVDVWGVVGHAAVFAAGGGENNLTVRVVHGLSATQLGDIVAGDVSDTTLRYVRAPILDPQVVIGQSWLAAFNSIRLRVGFSSDTAPLPRCSAVLLQVVVIVATEQTATMGLISQAGVTSTPTFSNIQTLPIGLISNIGTVTAPAFLTDLRWVNRFDGGTDAAVVTTGNSGGASGDSWDAVFISAASTLTYNAANALHGTMAVAVNPGANAIAYMQWNETRVGLLNEWYGRVYVKLTTIPTGTSIVLVDLRDSATAINRSRLAITSTGLLRTVDAVGTTIATGATPMVANVWSRIEFHWIGHATAGFFEAKLFNSAESGTATETITNSGLNTGGTIDRIRWGHDSSAAADLPVFYLDSIELNANAYPGIFVAEAQTVTVGLISNPATTPGLAELEWGLTMGLIDDAGTVTAPTFSNPGDAQVVELDVIASGWGQPWGTAWGGEGSLVFAPNVQRGINLGLIDNSGTVTAPTFNPNRVTLGLISVPGQAIPPVIPHVVTLGLIEQAGDATVGIQVMPMEVALISQVPALFAPSFNPQTLSEMVVIERVGETITPQQFTFTIAFGLVDNAGTVSTPSIVFGLGLGLIDNAGTVAALTISSAPTLGLIDNSGTVSAPQFFQSNNQTVTVGLVDQTPEVWEPSEFSLFDVDQTITLDLIEHAGVAHEPVTVRAVVPIIHKKARYRPTARFHALYVFTIRNRGEWSIDE